MPYNLDLERRIDRVAPRMGVFEKKKMFGGVGYLMKGNMAFGIHKQALIIRTSSEQAEELLKKEEVSVFNMTGRPMKGWLLVSPEGVRTEKELLDYLSLAIDFARSLPGK